MWNTAMMFYGNYAAEISTYYQAAPWISEHLAKGEMVFLPIAPTFWALNQTLKDQTYTYNSVYHFPNGTKFAYSPIITPEEKIIARENFVSFVHDNKNNVKYVVINWLDNYGKLVTGNQNFDYDKYRACKNFDNNSTEVKQFSFTNPFVKWGSSIIICKV